MDNPWNRKIWDDGWDACEQLPGRLRDDCSCRKIILFSDRQVDRLHYPGPSFQESLPILSALFAAQMKSWAPSRNPQSKPCKKGRSRTIYVPLAACGRCCFYSLQLGAVFSKGHWAFREGEALMGTRPAPWSGVIFLTRPVGLISGSSQLAAGWWWFLAVRGGSRGSVQSGTHTRAVGAHIWLQDALNTLSDKGAWSGKVRAGSVVLPRVKTVVKVNKGLSWLLVYPNKGRRELLTQGFHLPFQGHRKVSSASNCCISLKGRMIKCGLGKYMVLFLKGCSTEIAEMVVTRRVKYRQGVRNVQSFAAWAFFYMFWKRM